MRSVLTFCWVGVLLAAITGCGSVHSASPSPTPTPTPVQPPSIQNVIVVIMQNRSFDHLFGEFPGANGIKPGVPGFTQKDAKGATVTDSTEIVGWGTWRLRIRAIGGGGARDLVSQTF